MSNAPVSAKTVDCGDGKRKIIVREREYDIVSWAGLKLIGTMLISIAGIVMAVLTAYYSAEAAQTDRMMDQAKDLSRMDERQKAVDNTLKAIDTTLKAQYTIIRENNNTLIEVKTTQTLMKERFEQIADDVKQLNNKQP